jgi:NADP-dependent 3-hydroxy acid dehydrogenase YdfG
MYQELKGRVAIVTGASRGLGRELSKYLVGQGVKVAGIARTQTYLDELKEEIGNDDMMLCYSADVGDYTAMEKIADEVAEKWGRIDILINNAGFKPESPLEEMSLELIDRAIDTMIKGTIYISRIVAPVMMNAKSGCIINITSTSALRGLNSNGVYFACKHAQKGYADSLSKYLAPYNIHVCTLCPGGMDTPFWDPIEHHIHTSSDQLMKVDEIARIIDLILHGHKDTLYKQITVFPISEAEYW